jgi:hypothetical protein
VDYAPSGGPYLKFVGDLPIAFRSDPNRGVGYVVTGELTQPGLTIYWLADGHNEPVAIAAVDYRISESIQSPIWLDWPAVNTGDRILIGSSVTGEIYAEATIP